MECCVSDVRRHLTLGWAAGSCLGMQMLQQTTITTPPASMGGLDARAAPNDAQMIVAAGLPCSAHRRRDVDGRVAPLRRIGADLLDVVIVPNVGAERLNALLARFLRGGADLPSG